MSAVELDKFENAGEYSDMKVMTVFIGDENLDRAYFKPRGVQMKQNVVQRTNNRAIIAEQIKQRKAQKE